MHSFCNFIIDFGGMNQIKYKSGTRGRKWNWADTSDTGWSLNIVSFFENFKYILDSGLCFPSLCTLTTKWQVEHQRCSRTCRVQKNQNILRKETQYLMYVCTCIYTFEGNNKTILWHFMLLSQTNVLPLHIHLFDQRKFSLWLIHTRWSKAF